MRPFPIAKAGQYCFWHGFKNYRCAGMNLVLIRVLQFKGILVKGNFLKSGGYKAGLVRLIYV